MADNNSGIDYSQLVASGAIGGSNARSGSAIGAGQPSQGGMMPSLEGRYFELPIADVDFGLSNADSMFASINKDGGAFGQSLASQLGDSASFLGTPEAKGDNNINLENLGQGERQMPPTIQGDLQMNKGLSFKGNSGAAQGG